MPAFPTTLFTDSLGCPTCFSPQLQHPMLLVPCGHTVCRSCLDDLPGPPKQCPICSSPIESACTNFLVQRLVSEESQDPFVQCDDCGWSGRATKYDEHPDNVRKHRAQQAANSAAKSPGNLDNAPGSRPQQQPSTVDTDAVSGKPTAASSRAAAARAVVTARQRLHGAVRSTAAKANHALTAWEHQEEKRVSSELEAVSDNGAGGHNDGVEVEVLWDTELDGFFTKVDATITEASTIEDQRPSSPQAADDDNNENESKKVEKNGNDVDKAQRSAATVSVTADVFRDPLSAYQQIMEALLEAEVISGAHEIRTKVFVDVARAALSTRARNALTHLSSSSSTSKVIANEMTSGSDERQTLEKIQALFTQEDGEGGVSSSSSSHGVDEAHRSLRPLLGGLPLILETSSSSKSSASKMSEANSASPIDEGRLKEIVAAGASPDWGSLTDFACEIVPQISTECRRKVTALLPSSVSNLPNERQTAPPVSAEAKDTLPKAPDAQSTHSSQAKAKSPSSSLPFACGVARAVDDLIAMSKAVNVVTGSSKCAPKVDTSGTAAAAAVVLPAVAFVCGSTPPTGMTAMITALRRVGRKVFIFHGISDPKKRRVFDLFASKSFFIEQLGQAAVVRRSAADMPLLSVPQMVSSSPNADATSSETQAEDKHADKAPKALELTASKTTVMSFLSQVQTEIHGPEITAAMAALNDAMAVAESVTTNIDDSPQAATMVDGVSSANVGQASGSLLLPHEQSAGNNTTGGSKGGVAFQQQSSATTDAGSDVPRSDFDAAFIAQWAQQTHPTSGGSTAFAPVGTDIVHTHDSSNSHSHSHPDLQTVKDHTSSTAGSIAGPLMTSSTTHGTELSSQTLATTSTSAATTSVQIAGKPAAASGAAQTRVSGGGEAPSLVRGGSARQAQAGHQEHQDPFLGATFSTSAAPFQRQLVMSNRERTAAFSAVTGADGGIESLGVVESGAVDFTGLHAIHMQSSSDLNIAASLASATASTTTTNTNADARSSGVVGKTELPTQSGRSNNAPTSPTQPMLNVAVRAPKKPDAVPVIGSQGTNAPQAHPVGTASVGEKAPARSSAKSSAKSSESIEKAVHAAPFVPPSAGGSGFTPPTPAGFSPTLAPASAAAAPTLLPSGGVHVQVGQVAGAGQFGLTATSNAAGRGAPELGLRVGASAFSPPALSSDNNGPSVAARSATSRADGRESGGGRPIASSSSQSSVSASSRGGEGKRHQFGTSAPLSTPQQTTTPLSYQGQSFIPKHSGAPPPHSLQESQSGPQGQRPQLLQQQQQQQPRRVEFVLVDGEKIAVEDLLQNRGLTYLLEHPSASGRWCKTQHPNASAPRACGFVHWKPGRRSGSATPSGLHGSFAGTATPTANAPTAASAAPAAVAPSPVAAMKAPATGNPDPILEAVTSEVARDGVGSPLKKPEDTYRMTEFVVVEGERVQCQELVFNTGLYFLQSHPNRQGRWCRGHPAHVKDEECSFIHSTDNDRMPTEGKADMPARVEVEGQSVELWKLVYNAGIKRIVTGVAASAKWCRGHPQNITDETCTYIHAKPDVPEPEGQP